MLFPYLRVSTHCKMVHVGDRVVLCECQHINYYGLTTGLFVCLWTQFSRVIAQTEPIIDFDWQLF